MPEPTSDRTRLHRHAERGADLASVHRILDEALTCTVAWVDPDGALARCRRSRRASTTPLPARIARGARGRRRRRREVCVVATLIDELVLARTSPTTR
jgi:hypothetical protein